MSNKWKMTGLWLLSFYCFLSLLAAPVVQAEEGSNKRAAFLVEKLPSDHELDREKGYFDLRVSPNEGLDIQFQLKNLTRQPLKIVIEPAYGTTNINGLISYQTDATQKPKDLGVSFPELAKVDSPVELGPKEEKTVNVHIQMPPDPYKGIILGGIYFRELSTNEEEQQEKIQKRIAIHTEYSYLIGVQLSESEERLPEKVDLNYVKPDQINGENVFAVGITHPVMQILNEVRFEGDIYAKGQMKKPVYTAKQSGVRLAPNSQFIWQMPLSDHPFKVGEYTLKLKVSAGEEHCEFERTFQVTAKDVEKFNQKNLFVAEEKPKRSFFWLYVLLGIFVVLIGGGSALAYWRFPRARKAMKQTAKKFKQEWLSFQATLFEKEKQSKHPHGKKHGAKTVRKKHESMRKQK